MQIFCERLPSSSIRIPGIPSVKITENKCFICNKKSRRKIPISARLDVWLKLKVFIPPNNRICTNHLEFGIFLEECLNTIQPMRNYSLMNESTISKWILQITDLVAVRQAPLNFDKESVYTEEDYSMMLGVSKEQFEILLEFVKKDIHNR